MLSGLAHVGPTPLLAYADAMPRVMTWVWAVQVVGDSRCPIVDTWWQTETGSHLITPLPGATPLKPGSATLPFFGVEPAVLNEKGEELQGEAEGLVYQFPASCWHVDAVALGNLLLAVIGVHGPRDLSICTCLYSRLWCCCVTKQILLAALHACHPWFMQQRLHRGT